MSTIEIDFERKMKMKKKNEYKEIQEKIEKLPLTVHPVMTL